VQPATDSDAQQVKKPAADEYAQNADDDGPDQIDTDAGDESIGQHPRNSPDKDSYDKLLKSRCSIPPGS